MSDEYWRTTRCWFPQSERARAHQCRRKWKGNSQISIPPFHLLGLSLMQNHNQSLYIFLRSARIFPFKFYLLFNFRFLRRRWSVMHMVGHIVVFRWSFGGYFTDIWFYAKFFNNWGLRVFPIWFFILFYNNLVSFTLQSRIDCCTVLPFCSL